MTLLQPVQSTISLWVTALVVLGILVLLLLASLVDVVSTVRDNETRIERLEARLDEPSGRLSADETD